MKNNIASERVRLGMSRGELAAQLHVSQDSIKNWENGITEIKSQNLINMAGLFGCSIDYLLNRTNERVFKVSA